MNSNIDSKLYRHIDKNFIEAFLKSGLYRLYDEHRDELIVGIRNGYLNLYYRCDSIAKVSLDRDGKLRFEINDYFTEGPKPSVTYTTRKGEVKRKSGNGNVAVAEGKIIARYEDIKRRCREKKSATEEKCVQQLLFSCNNSNPEAKYYCVDVEWKKQFEKEDDRNKSGFNGRFDIVAVSKSVPHRLAVIELKYGNGALGGASGVTKHIADFKKFSDLGYVELFRREMAAELEALREIDVHFPPELRGVEADDILPEVDFYFILLDNNSSSPAGSTPLQTMGAYLFKEGSRHYDEWAVKTPTKNNVMELERLQFDVLDQDCPLPAHFLFSSQTLETFAINDILEDSQYDKFYHPGPCE